MRKKLLFMGTPEYAKIVLEKLAKHFEIVGVFTKPDKPVGRKMELQAPPVKILANELNLKLFQPENLKNSAAIIKDLKPDFIVVAAYGELLSAQILNIAPCINLHASILPAFRGASPIQDMILKGAKIGGVTAMKMGVGLDDGDMLAFCACDIENKSAKELFDEFSKMAASLALKTLENYENIAPLEQFGALASKCKKIKKDNGLIDFNDDISAIWRKFLAFNPWPGIYLKNGTKLLDIEILNKKNCEIGKICAINDDSFCVGVNGGIVKIKSLQEVGKKALSAKEYINGKRLKIADYF